jgi:D-proline reductase (dithiol) PrdB
MCNQAVCLLAAEIERRGIATVCIVLLREIAEKVRPPRALAVPFPHGFPLGAPHDARLQREVLMAALRLLESEAPSIAELPSRPARPGPSLRSG